MTIRSRTGDESLGTPVILTGVYPKNDKEFDASKWTRGALIQECGHTSIIGASHSIKYLDDYRPKNESFGGFHTANLHHGIQTFGDFLRFQDTPEGSNLYMFDGSTTRLCPSAVERLRVPNIQARNYAMMRYEPDVTLQGMMRDTCQSFFIIGKRGSGTHLHSDSHMEGTWSQALSGRKLWRLFPPTEYDRLYPNKEDFAETNDEGQGYYPDRFAANAMEPDFEAFPKLDGAVLYEVILEPGESLLVPQAWPHQVLNLEDAVSVGINILDYHDQQTKRRYLKFVESDKDYVHNIRNRLYEAFFFPLDHAIPGRRNEHLTYREFCGASKSLVLYNIIVYFAPDSHTHTRARAIYLIYRPPNVPNQSGMVQQDHGSRHGRGSNAGSTDCDRFCQGPHRARIECLPRRGRRPGHRRRHALLLLIGHQVPGGNRRVQHQRAERRWQDGA